LTKIALKRIELRPYECKNISQFDASGLEDTKYRRNRSSVRIGPGDVRSFHTSRRQFIVSPSCSFTTGFTFDLTGGRATY
jgi:hypothetical protein